VAVEQGGFHGRFQVRQPFADGRGRQELALRRPPDTAQLAYRNKKLQRGQVDTARKVALGAGHGSKGPLKNEVFVFSSNKYSLDIAKRDV
jgi:hypothetical protein